MDNLEKLLFLTCGIAIGAVVVIVLIRVLGTGGTTQSSQSYTLAKNYHNEEKWQFAKDDSGRVTGVSVTRRAEEN